MELVPLFPLPLVFFPGGRLPLQIFETRYLDMVRDCMRQDRGFGVISIHEGEQVLTGRSFADQLAQPGIAGCGTEGQIVDFDQNPNGTLAVTVLGQRKFSVLNVEERADRLMVAEVEWLPDEPEQSLPQHFEHLAELLESISQHEAVFRLGLSVDYDDARDVSWRLAELLPCDLDTRQRLLELQSPLKRLTEIERVIETLQASQL